MRATWGLTFCLLALFLHLVPFEWLAMLPIFFAWLVVAMFISKIVTTLVSEWFDDN